MAVPVVKPQLTLFRQRPVAATSALCWQLQRTELEEQDKVSGGRELLHWQIQTSSQETRFWLWHFSLLLQSTHDEKEEIPFARGSLLDFCIGAAHKGVRSVLRQECYIILAVGEAPCSPAQLKRAISKLDGESWPLVLFGYCNLDCCMGHYSRWYSWASLQAFIWCEWGSFSVPLDVGFLWEMWITNVKSQHVRAPGLCWGCITAHSALLRWLGYCF